MGKKKFIIIPIFLIILVVCCSFYIKNVFFKKDKNDLINISELSEEFMDNYFKEISSSNTDKEKENMLIVISSTKIKDSYGSKRIIEAPNNQYILQYSSIKEKELALKKLREDKNIYSVEENTIYKTENVDYNSWGIEKMSLDYAITSANANSENMQSVTAAIIDTGCDIGLFNKYYGGKISEFYNILENSTTVMNDEEGHGTHIAGTIAEGTSDNVKILPIKVSRDGSMYDSDIIAAINYIVYNNKAQVINMSFGSYTYTEAAYQAIESAKRKKIISVAAAGNEHSKAKSYPAAFDNTISIASVDSNLTKSTFSNYGSTITFAAPGTNIRSIMGKDASLSKRNGNNDDDDHEIISGTSMATPHAAAAVAILKGYNENLTFENVIDILKENAQDLGEKGWDQYYGNGLISFKDVEFCDGNYCDELGIYKDLTKSISNIEVASLNFTKYNYYSITNLMGSKINFNYADNTSEEIAVGELPNVEILNYNPTATGSQTVTIKIGSLTTTTQVTNPNNYESGWEYNTLPDGKIEITGYKNHNLGIKKLYVPESIDSKLVVSFADNFKFVDSGVDIESYTYLYLPSTFTRIGNYSLAGTNIKYVYGTENKIEVGAHAFENSKIVSIDIPIIKIEDYSFKDCFELVSIKVWEEQYAGNNSLIIGKYAFYNCKKLVRIEMTNEQGYNLIGDIGDYAFYNCVSLSYFDLKPIANIGEYAFYGTYMLFSIDLYSSVSIGKYAFYESGISEAKFGMALDIIRESTFENCRNLKKISISKGRIEKRAFWESGIEKIFLGNVEYIAEDAFAYSPVKSQDGTISTDSIYQVVNGLGIVENGNKLLVGFTNASGASNTRITEDITEIGNYAFTGNNNLRKITIPANVTKIGTYAFKDCYQLSDVYMLGTTINFGNDTFKRTYEGEIQGADFKIYVYKDSAIKQFIKQKDLNYRHIEPDEIVVTNYEYTYKALSKVDLQSLGVKLIYHEEGDREEILDPLDFSTDAPISNGVGFIVSYQTENGYNFQYGDTYFVVETKNQVGYLSTQNVGVTVEKVTPTYTVPTGLTANFGQQLSEITLPEHFAWMDGSQVITESGEAVYKAKYVPTDTKNYETVENIDITITVSNSKTIVSPKIAIGNKIYDGTTNIPLSNITISNLESSEYSVVSAISSSPAAGQRNATVVLRLSNEKFKNYAFSNGQQEKEFTVDFEILKANIIVTDNSKNVTVEYDGNYHSIDLNLECQSNVIIKYMDENNEYSLSTIPRYKNIGTYIIKYKVYIDNNYTEYFGQKNLVIEELNDCIINKYEVDESNNYISKVTINTDVDAFKSNFDLVSGYSVDVDYKLVNNKKLLYTGGKTRIKNGTNLYKEFINIVIGDINGDAEINSADLLRQRQHLLKTKILSGIYFLASDINYDNDINSADLLRTRQHLLGIKPIE